MSEFDNTIARDKEKKRAQFKTVSIVIAVSIVLFTLLYIGGKAIFSGMADDAHNGSAITERPTVAVDSETNAALREQAQAALSGTRQQLNAVNDQPAFKAYLDAQYTELQELLDEALVAYTSTHYAEALEHLHSIQQQLSRAQQEHQSAYQDAYTRAQQAFNAGDIDSAQQANQQSLRLNPDYSPALALQNRIDVFDDVADLMRQVQIAMVEKDLPKQQDALQQVLLLDSEHEEAKEALRDVEQQLNEQAYAAAIARAIRFLDSGQLNQAESALNQASQLFSNRSEVNNLRMRIQTERTALELQAIEQQLNVFQAADEWPTVVMVANNALQKHPSHEPSQRALELGQTITQMQSAVNRYSSQPSRLSDLTVLQNAEQLLLSARVFTSLSGKLAAAVAELENVIEVANTPIDVLLISDNQTFVRVLGVGNVGTHAEYQFQLKPGVYQFEGRRSGYRSKIVTVTVTQSETPIEVRLAADERI
ncbi:hypothetical protein [Aliidiomarina sp.]|uniref:hypothetical protein n=1 Tax=Aliidiomarina sp. TaxID=1872439 RepID=UPI003A4E4DA0